jgi:hypothetical protein
MEELQEVQLTASESLKEWQKPNEGARQDLKSGIEAVVEELFTVRREKLVATDP